MSYLDKLKEVVPQKFFNLIPKENYDIVYLLDINEDQYLYISPPEKLLGYNEHVFFEKGSDFTFSLIYPLDYQRVILDLTSSFQDCDLSGRFTEKGVLMRMKHENGNWVWINRIAIAYKEKDVYKVIGLVKDASDDKNIQKILIEETESKQKVLKKITGSINSVSEVPEEIETPTEREFEVLRLLCEGLSTKIIASKLGIADNTVNEHRKKLHKKFNVHSCAELISKVIRKFIRKGLL
jgi:DNA-binding CsgD family transcriptional regulator